MKKYGKPFIAIVVLLATLGMFSWYIHGHPEVLKQLRRVPITTLFILLALYAVWWIALAVTLQISLHLYHKKMPMSENIMLSAYSSLLNFFGPGQSGPGLRAIYLKKKHDLDIKKYIFATLLYYMFYAVISAGLLFAMVENAARHYFGWGGKRSCTKAVCR